MKKTKRKNRRPPARVTRPKVKTKPKGPPVEHQFKPGVSGNPAGRPKNAGESLRELMNAIVATNPTEADLRAIASDKREPMPRRGVAIRLLRTLELPDCADFDEAVNGDKTLTELRDDGLATDAVKKFKRKKRTITTDEGLDETIETELELHDRAAEAMDAIIGHTDGTPTQRVAFVGDNLPAAVMIVTPLTRPPDAG